MASPRKLEKKKAVKKSKAKARVLQKAKRLAKTVITIGTEIVIDAAMHAITERLTHGNHYAPDMTDPSRKLY